MINISKILLFFVFLLQVLFYIGYNYANDLSIFFSFSSIFDEEFVIMFAMFLVLCISFIYSMQTFSLMFTERIESLNKFFVDNFDQVLVNVNSLLNVFNKLMVLLQFNFMVINVLNENILFLLIQLELKQSVVFLNFSKVSLFKDRFFSDFLMFSNIK